MRLKSSLGTGKKQDDLIVLPEKQDKSDHVGVKKQIECDDAQDGNDQCDGRPFDKYFVMLHGTVYDADNGGEEYACHRSEESLKSECYQDKYSHRGENVAFHRYVV